MMPYDRARISVQLTGHAHFWHPTRPPGRPPVPDELVALILRPARENTRYVKLKIM
jgi:hypothetical protein